VPRAGSIPVTRSTEGPRDLDMGRVIAKLAGAMVWTTLPAAPARCGPPTRSQLEAGTGAGKLR
jgi:hypothetical protein